MRKERRLKAKHDVRKNSSPRQQARILEHHADVRLAAVLCNVAKNDGSGSRRFQTHDGPQQSTLATSAAADNGHKFTGGYVNVEVFQDGAFTEGDADILDCD